MTKNEIAVELAEMAALRAGDKEKAIKRIILHKKDEIERVYRGFLYDQYNAMFAVSVLTGLFPATPISAKK